MQMATAPIADYVCMSFLHLSGGDTCRDDLVVGARHALFALSAAAQPASVAFTPVISREGCVSAGSATDSGEWSYRHGVEGRGASAIVGESKGDGNWSGENLHACSRTLGAQRHVVHVLSCVIILLERYCRQSCSFDRSERQFEYSKIPNHHAGLCIDFIAAAVCPSKPAALPRRSVLLARLEDSLVHRHWKTCTLPLSANIVPPAPCY